MHYRLYAAGLVAVFSSSALAQQSDMPAPSGSPAVASAAVGSPATAPVLLKRDTPLEMLATKEISTADVAPGTHFKLRVNQPILIGGKTVVPVGAWAYGEVTSAEDSGGLGKSGRMTAKLLYLQLGNAQIPLDGETSAKGTGAGSAGVAFIFAGWVALFHRGNNAKIKAGELVGGFVAEDTWLDLSANPVQRVAAPPAIVPAVATSPAPADGPPAASTALPRL